MLKLDKESTFKRLRNRYRLVVMNDDTYEEVVTFKLSRMSVYIMLSTIFVVLVGLTVALIIFTPLKYYIPGAKTDYKSVQEYRDLKYQVDAANEETRKWNQYLEALKVGPLNAGATVKLDTTQINIPKSEEIDD